MFSDSAAARPADDPFVVADAREASGALRVRRYRLARVQLNAARAGGVARHEHLKRLHD